MRSNRHAPGASRVRAADRLVRGDEAVPVRRVPAGGAGRGGGGQLFLADADGLGLQPLLAPANLVKGRKGNERHRYCPLATRFGHDTTE